MIQPKNECIVIEIESSILFNINISQSTTIIETDDDKQYSENKYFSSEIITTTIIETFPEIMTIIENLMDILKNETVKKTRKEEIDYYDAFIQNIETIFTSKYFNTTKIDEGKDEIYETQKIKVTFTTSKNQKNNLNDNTTSIDLGKCEEELKKFYNLKDNEIIYIRKMDIIQEGMRIPKIEYDVYSKLNGDNLVKLNLSICNKTEIYLYIPIKDIGNLDQLNKSSGYYNDICSTATSESGTDIIHEDRQKEYINKTVCQNDCDFNNYNSTSQKAICSCKVKESSSSFAYMHINGTELLNNFKHMYNIMNIKILSCVKQLFSKIGIIKNVGNYIMIVVIINHIIDLFIFFINHFEKLKKKIKDIIDATKNSKSTKDHKDNNKCKDKDIKNNINNEIKEDDKNNNKIIPKNNIKKRKKKKKKKKKKRYNAIKNKKVPYIDINNNDNIIENRIINTIINNYSKTENKIMIETKNETMEYINDELNELPYNLALQYDTRTFCQYYISLLRIKQTLIFSFYYNNDYNSKIIKIDLFFVGFSIFYTIEALFYNDDTIHNLYETKGSYGIENQLPKIIYSSIISMALNTLLKLLALSNDSIIKFKQSKNKDDINEKGEALNHTLSIKFIFYFIFSSLLLLFFWYYLSIFGAVYINTQYHLLKDTLVSFGLSLLYPFGLCLLPGIFRIPALSDPKKKKLYLYKFSKILQIF